MHGVILEVRSSEPRRATALLREKFPANSVGLFGDRVHVVAAEPETTASAVEMWLAGAGLELEGIRRIEPGLEDVFVSVLSSAGNEEGHAQP
jgi:ABC-2 type transport system ATP-binding protein